jgi:hypothetical protein
MAPSLLTELTLHLPRTARALSRFGPRTSDGSNQVQLTSLDAANGGSPQWTRDGKTIAFDARLKGHADIFVVSADGGSTPPHHRIRRK